ncbi:solute carrier family 35 member F5-like isoform X10 [Lampetra planeri]
MDGGRAGPMQTRRRMLLGIGVLLLVDFIWVASSELTWYIYTEFNKPFFSTFVKTSLFSFYLLGFVLWPPWRRACAQGCPTQSREPLYVPVEDNEEDNTTGERPSEGAAGPAEGAATPAECRTPLLQDSVSAEGPPPGNRKLSVAQVAKLSFSFCFVWFLANFSYQQALAYTHVAIVNIISSTSGLFTLVLAAFLPSSSNDRFSLSKLLAVLLRLHLVLAGSSAVRHIPCAAAAERRRRPSAGHTHVLRGCFLTTSLMGTLALSLTIPLSIVTDIFTQKASFSWLFFLGAMPIFLSFFGTALLNHYSNWDPVGALAMKGAALLCSRRQRRRSPEDIAQTSRLIPEE